MSSSLTVSLLQWLGPQRYPPWICKPTPDSINLIEALPTPLLRLDGERPGPCEGRQNQYAAGGCERKAPISVVAHDSCESEQDRGDGNEGQAENHAVSSFSV